MENWIDAREKEPDSPGRYLVHLDRKAPEDLGGDSHRITILRWTKEGWRLPRHFPAWINKAITETVTHWMELPESPFAEEVS